MAGVDHLHELMAYLESKSCGTRGRTLFANAQPDETTAATVFIFERSGQPPQFTYSTSAFIRTPRFTIAARSTQPTQGDYPDITNARNLAQRAYDACRQLSGRISSTVSHSTSNWLSALPVTEPYLAGRDDLNRVRFDFEVDALRQG